MDNILMTNFLQFAVHRFSCKYVKTFYLIIPYLPYKIAATLSPGIFMTSDNRFILSYPS